MLRRGTPKGTRDYCNRSEEYLSKNFKYKQIIKLEYLVDIFEKPNTISNKSMQKSKSFYAE